MLDSSPSPPEYRSLDEIIDLVQSYAQDDDLLCSSDRPIGHACYVAYKRFGAFRGPEWVKLRRELRRLEIDAPACWDEFYFQVVEAVCPDGLHSAGRKAANQAIADALKSESSSTPPPPADLKGSELSGGKAGGQADSKPDKRKNLAPRNLDVAKLALKIKRDLPKGGTKEDIALEYTGNNAKKAANLLRQLRPRASAH
jgi:hypothetical protein